MTPRSALIVFAKSPRPGEVKTRLGLTLGMERAAAVYREFAQHAFSLARRCARQQISVYLFYAPGSDPGELRELIDCPQCITAEQEGESLGDRMRNAFDLVFQGGAERAVIIGTDVPELEMSSLESALSQLGSHDVVLGPSRDGGYYLLGMNAPPKDLFEGIPWSSGAVGNRTRRRIQSLGLSCAVLPELADIDTEEDYRQYLARRDRVDTP